MSTRIRRCLYAALSSLLVASLLATFLPCRTSLAYAHLPVRRGSSINPLPTGKIEPSATGSLAFTENVGQFDAEARFLVRGGGGTAWLAENAIWLTVLEQPGKAQWQKDGSRTVTARRGVNIRLTFPGANLHPRLEPFNRLEAHVNYYTGNDPAGWREDVPVWGGVRYVDVYPGLDLEITSEAGQWNWRLIERAGARSVGENVHLRIEGAEVSSVNSSAVVLTTAVGKLAFPLLDWSGADEAALPALWLAGNQVTAPFARPAAYNPLAGIQSPQDSPGALLLSTFLGGNNDERAQGIALDASDNVYVTGWTMSTDFPTTPGLDTFLGGNADVFVTKLSADGSSLVYSSYLGGSYQDSNYADWITESGNAIAVDSSGSAYVTGWTWSSDFPTTAGAYDPTFSGESPCTGASPPRPCSDAVVVKLNPSGALVYGTYLGGSGVNVPGGSRIGGNEAGEGIAVRDGIIYLTGWTRSEDFPTTPGAYKRVFSNVDIGLNFNVFVVKLNPLGSGSADLLYSTFVGGGIEAHGRAIAVDSTGAVYVTGETGDLFAPEILNDFPTTLGAYKPTNQQPDIEAFYFKLNPAGNGTADLVYSTFLGSDTDWDEGHAIAVDNAGQVYLTGYTSSANFPTTAGAYDRLLNGSSDAFVSKLALSGGGAADLLYSTFLGGSNAESDVVERGDIALGTDGDVYVAGLTWSSDFTTTLGAYDSSFNGGYHDAFMTRLRLAGTDDNDLIYSTYLGGWNSDAGRGIALGKDGTVYVAGSTFSSDFPATTGAYDTLHNGGEDEFVARIKPMTPTTLHVDAYVQAPALSGGPPGGVASIAVRYGNLGATTAASVTLTATLHISLTYVGDTSGITPTQATSNTHVWQLPDLSFAAGEQFALQVRLPDVPWGTHYPDVPWGTRYPVTLTLTSAGPEADDSDNSSHPEVMIARQCFMPVVLKD